MFYQSLIYCLALLISCAAPLATNPINNEKTTVPPIKTVPLTKIDTHAQPVQQQPIAKDSRITPDTTKTQGIWEEYSEEDLAIEAALDDAMLVLSKALKRGRILRIQLAKPICLILKKTNMTKDQIGLFYTSSAPGVQPISTGESIEAYELPAAVTFRDQERYFWYDADGNIDFAEADQTLRIFDNPPQGDVFILPRNPNIPRCGLVDINKQRTQLEFYQYIIKR